MKSIGARAIVLAVLGTALIHPDVRARADEEANIARLRAMPLEYRQELKTRQEAFTKLPRNEQERIRTLDVALEALDGPTRARYQAVLRRYRLWLDSLDEEARKRIDAFPAERRIEVIREELTRHPATMHQPIDDVAARTTTLNSFLIFDQLYWVRTWLKLTPAQRSEIEKERAPERRFERLEALGRELGVPDARPGLVQRFEQETIRRLNESRRNAKAERNYLESLKPETAKAMVRRGVEARYLRNVQAGPVAPANLDRFVRALPGWLRESLDPLPPQAARARLAILYRLVFPEPEEMPIGKAEERPATEPERPGPSSQPTGPGAPF